MTRRCWGMTLVLVLVGACATPIEDDTARELRLRPQGDIPVPEEPTVMRMVVKIEGNTVSLVSAQPRRGNTWPAVPGEHMTELREGRAMLLEYVVRSAEDVLSTGQVLISLVAKAEWMDPERRHHPRIAMEPLPHVIVKVNVPFDAAMQSVEFAKLDPDPERSVKEWKRVPMGSVEVRGQ